MVDFAGEAASFNPEVRLRQIADYRHDPTLGRAPSLDQLLELADRSLPAQHKDRAFTLQQPLEQVAPDEAGGSRDEVAHGALPTAE